MRDVHVRFFFLLFGLLSYRFVYLEAWRYCRKLRLCLLCFTLICKLQLSRLIGSEVSALPFRGCSPNARYTFSFFFFLFGSLSYHSVYLELNIKYDDIEFVLKNFGMVSSLHMSIYSSEILLVPSHITVGTLPHIRIQAMHLNPERLLFLRHKPSMNSWVSGSHSPDKRHWGRPHLIPSTFHTNSIMTLVTLSHFYLRIFEYGSEGKYVDDSFKPVMVIRLTRWRDVEWGVEGCCDGVTWDVAKRGQVFEDTEAGHWWRRCGASWRAGVREWLLNNWRWKQIGVCYSIVTERTELQISAHLCSLCLPVSCYL